MQARIEIARVLARHGSTDEVPLPDVSTKEKAQKYIGLDMDELHKNKEKFLETVVPKWVKKAKEKGLLIAAK